MQGKPKPLPGRLQGLRENQGHEACGSHQRDPEDRSYFHGFASYPKGPLQSQYAAQKRQPQHS